MFQLPQFVWALRSSVWDFFVNFLLIDATDRSKISGDQKRFFIALSLYPLSFFANTPFNSRILLLKLSWQTNASNCIKNPRRPSSRLAAVMFRGTPFRFCLKVLKVYAVMQRCNWWIIRNDKFFNSNQQFFIK